MGPVVLATVHGGICRRTQNRKNAHLSVRDGSLARSSGGPEITADWSLVARSDLALYPTIDAPLGGGDLARQG